MTDANRGAIPNATVTVVEVQAGRAAAAATTDEEGRAIFGSLVPGDYEVTAGSAGFARRSSRINLAGGRLTSVSFRLALATVAQAVTVTAVVERPLHEEDLTSVAIREGAARDLGESLEQLAGVWKVRRGGIANDVVLRGFQLENVSVQFDGLRLYGACPNHMDPPVFHVDFAEIERVEVTKGPYDVTSQGSLGGAINVVRKKQTPGLRVSPRLSLGSFQSFNPSIAASYANQRLHGGGGFSSRRGGVYRDARGLPVTNYANYQPRADALNAYGASTGWLSLGAAVRPRHLVDLNYARQAVGRTLYPYLQMDAVYDTSDRAQANYMAANPLRGVSSFSVIAYLSTVRHWMTDQWRQSAAAGNIFSMASYASTRAVGGTLDVKAGRWSFGTENFYRNWNVATAMRRIGMQSTQEAVPDVDTRLSAAWASYTRSLSERVSVTAAGRLQHASMHAREAVVSAGLAVAYFGRTRSSATDTDPSGNARLVFRLPAGMELFLGAGTAVRIPDAAERYYNLKRAGTDWVGNPWLEPTRNTQLDLGLRIRQTRFSVAPTVFYGRLHNYISVFNRARLAPGDAAANSSARSYANVEARTYGGEFAYHLALTGTLTVDGDVSLVRGVRTAKPLVGIFDTDLAEMPPLRSAMSVRYAKGVVFVQAEARAAGAQRHVDSQLRERPSAGYAVFGLVGGLHLNRWMITAGIENIANRWYVEYLSYQRDPFRLGNALPEPGRALFANVQWNF